MTENKGWREFFIEDFAEIVNHRRVPLSTLERSNRKGGFPYYGASGIIDNIDDYLFEGKHILISEDGENLKSRKTPIAFEADGKFWVNNHSHILKCKKDYYNKILIYFFQNLDLNPFLTGAVQPKLNRASLISIPVFLPIDENEQKVIANVLSSLDDKIDLLHQQNETLETLAETLFRKWFIEDAKEDWKEGKLDDILTVKGGATPRTSESSYWNGTIYWTSPRDITNLKGIYLYNTERKITQLGLSKISSGLLPKGTLLMSSRAPVGVLAFAEIPLAINQGYIAMLDNKGVSKEFIYLWLKTNIDLVHSFSNGSTFMEISKSAFKTLKLQIPSKQVLCNFQDIVKPLFEKIKSNQQQIQTLTQMRDNLLPKLMSGELRVKM